jgi:hypothetical protein
LRQTGVETVDGWRGGERVALSLSLWCGADEQGRAAELFWSVRVFMQGVADPGHLRMGVLASLKSQLPTNTEAISSKFSDMGKWIECASRWSLVEAAIASWASAAEASACPLYRKHRGPCWSTRIL